ncbi:hypothetical protein EDB92DRAFT_1951269 [Lactarius akahatsu]|uniref:DUF6535 domain-containing protein n=1 Tax=Lactarius akahatsu TaxID=416441 RepID=A0AAD4LD28_9AGAM|nr:hypothetical protein EDB92DRAFT_1951269 [Lactarius akahatsu]
MTPSRSSSLDTDPDPGRISLNPAAATLVGPPISAPTVDNSAEIWSICLTHAEKFDRALVESWKGDMDGILIFSGLFSAVVSAFLVDSYKTLQPNASTTIPRDRLPPEGSFPLSPNGQTPFLIINALWFLSLIFSLACALSATLIQQWSRIYLQGTEERFIPHERARMRTYLQKGVQNFHLADMVNAIPMLLHISLFLFFGGLIVFLYNVDATLARIILAFVVPSLVLYTLLTALPVFYYDCPFKTPLTSVLSYITYTIANHRPRIRRRRNKHTEHLHWHPEQHSAYLTQLWAHDSSEEGAELDHTALRWTLLALTDLRDLEQFIGALPALLQSDSSSTLTRDGGRAAQALLFGQDMLAVHLVRLLHSTFPSDALALPPAERQRLEARAATCLRTVMLLARACDGPTLTAPQHWPAWAITYFNPVARDALALRQHPDLGVLAQSTALLLAWRALVAYRSFLDDIAQRAANAAAAPAMARMRAAVEELRSRKSAGEYLLRVLREVLHGLAGGTAGSMLADAGQELLGGNLYAHLYGPAAHGPRGGSGNGGAAGTTGAGPDVEMNGLAQAARADLPKAKACLAVLFMLGACSLPADPTGEETLHALAAPLAWQEPCLYDDQDEAMRLLLTVRNAYGDRLTVLDADSVVALYRTIHDPRHQRAQPSSSTAGGTTGPYLRPRRTNWRQGTV